MRTQLLLGTPGQPVYQGDYRRFPLVVTMGEARLPRDLTGARVLFTVDAPGRPQLEVTAHEDALGGRSALELTPAFTQGLPKGTWECEVRVVFPGPAPRVVARGQIVVAAPLSEVAS